ncbi:hypothetical protein L596_011485 [Steinernema carpocapsae]|uniref:Uncharacterized protein n=1 Tax=Steinernema carpocapsae TaxID=34508 RepID=A0A4U5NUZ3_STECR|nr:hypothetical protein L596_011485 [Steinernema carpocapsae]
MLISSHSRSLPRIVKQLTSVSLARIEMLSHDFSPGKQTIYSPSSVPGDRPIRRFRAAFAKPRCFSRDSERPAHHRSSLRTATLITPRRHLAASFEDYRRPAPGRRSSALSHPPPSPIPFAFLPPAAASPRRLLFRLLFYLFLANNGANSSELCSAVPARILSIGQIFVSNGLRMPRAGLFAETDFPSKQRNSLRRSLSGRNSEIRFYLFGVGWSRYSGVGCQFLGFWSLDSTVPNTD